MGLWMWLYTEGVTVGPVVEEACKKQEIEVHRHYSGKLGASMWKV